MSRFVTALTTVSAAVAVTMAVAPVSMAAPLLAGAPAQVREQAREQGGVDERSGPVAFANVASLAVVDDGTGTQGGSVISETQRSPLRPGASRLGDSRTALPGTAGERAAIGPNYLLRIGAHDVSATLERTHVPTATANTDFVLTDRGTGTTVLDFDAATSTVRCPSPDEVSARTSGGRLALLDRNGELTPVALPDDGEPVRRENLPFGPPIEIGEDERAVSDVTVRAVSSFGQLLRQDEWRDGDVTAVAGWLVRIDTRVTRADAPARPGSGDESAQPDEPGGDPSGASPGDESPGASQEELPGEGLGLDLPGEAHTGTADSDAEPRAEPHPRATGEGTDGARSRTIRTHLVLGGVSCSIPDDFAALPGDGGAAPAPSVPVRIPAGAPAPAPRDGGQDAALSSVDAAGSSGTGWGLGLLAGGAVLGVAAVLSARRHRGAVPSAEPEER